MRPVQTALILLALAGCQSPQHEATPKAPVQPAAAAPAPPASKAVAASTPAFQPKDETGAQAFLEQHPESDGRGIVVAIFDQGVDPGAPGLQVTSEGKTKIVDVVDGTGSGDVDTSTVVKAGEDGTITGLTGRTLRPSPEWTNPSGEWRIGMKPAWELFPRDLVSRMKTERRRTFDEQHRELEKQAASELDAFQQAHEKETDEEQRHREELEARLDHLGDLAKGFDDPGPIFDCVVFHDGDRWQAVVDTDEDGDLAGETLLEEYRFEHRYGTFSDVDLMNYAINVYDEGDILSIVVDSGPHGTHVAGTVAACFPGQPELDGIAPGAQVVSVKIGDTRVGSTSLGTGEVRGLIAVLRNKCDLINMSYGGSTGFPNHGRIIDLYKEVVNEHGVIFVASAGNSGPNLTTVGAPGGTTTEVIGVGAVLTPAMMRDQYSFLEPYDSLHYTWSSRGPASDGDLGVDISAPGGAVSPVPNWNLMRHRLMNGTSMASPNVCGCLALLCSGLKLEGQSWTPHSMQRAMSNTARPIPGMDRFSLGAGMIDVPAAWTYLQDNVGRSDDVVRYAVRTQGRHAGRGVYLREAWETDRPSTVRVSLSPIFPRDADKRLLVDFEMPLRLESTVDWIDAPGSVLLVHGGKSIDIHIDPTGLEPGGYFGEVLAFDASSSDSGPLLRIPVTVLRPVHLDASNNWTIEERLTYSPGEIRRWYLDVPEGATWVDLELQRHDSTTARTVVVQATQLEPGRPYTDANMRSYIRFRDEDRALRSIPAIGGRTMELTIAQYWSSLEEGDLELKISAHGLRPETDPVVLDGNRVVTTIDVTSTLGPEEIDPSGSLTYVRSWLQSKKRRIRPLASARDELPEKRRILELVQDYEFELEANASIRIWETDLPEMREYESTLILVFDEHKQLVLATVGDDWHSMSKGKYTARYHVRHVDRTALKDLADVPLRLERKLSKSISLKIRSNPSDALSGSSTYADRILRHGESAPIYIQSPSLSQQNKAGDPGDMLVGKIYLGSSHSQIVGAGRNPDGWPLELAIGRPVIAAKKPGKKEKDEDDPTTTEQLEDAIGDVEVRHLADFDHETERGEFTALVQRRLREDSGDLDVLSARLDWTRDDDTLEDGPHRREILESSDAIVKVIDQEQLAAWHGREHDAEDEDEEEAESMNEEREHLVAALMARAVVEAAMAREAGEDTAEERREAFEATWSELEQWTDPGDEDGGFDLAVDREVLRGRLATALVMVDARIKKHPRDRDLMERRIELLDALGWTYLSESEQRAMLVRFPEEHPPF